MKIAQFIDTTGVGGAETMLARLGQDLHNSGHELVVFHFGNTYLQQQCREYGFQDVVIPFQKLYKSILTVHLFSIRFAALLKQHGIQILHSHLYGSITGTFIGTWIYGIPHVGTLHDVYLVQERKGRGLLLRVAQAAGVQLVSVSEAMNRFYTDYIPFSRPLKNIYNGFEWHSTTSHLERPATAATTTTVTLIVVARLIPLKRHVWMIKALREILTENPVELLLVGDGPERTQIDSCLKDLNLLQQVKLLGERNDVQQLLAKADIFILPSRSEGLSCSIIEAMCSGLPCIASDVGGNSELIINNESGYLFDVDDQRAFAQACQALISNPDKRNQMGACAKSRADETFNLHTMTNEYITLYGSMS